MGGEVRTRVCLPEDVFLAGLGFDGGDVGGKHAADVAGGAGVGLELLDAAAGVVVVGVVAHVLAGGGVGAGDHLGCAPFGGWLQPVAGLDDVGFVEGAAYEDVPVDLGGGVY
jgi:hypothetical protein